MISDFDLRFGDSDAHRRWGGEGQPPGELASQVADLNAALVAVGVAEAKDLVPRGEFGVGTRESITRLQWYMENIPGYINADGAFVAQPNTVCTVRDGMLRGMVRSTLRTWTRWNFSCGGNLLRGSFDDYDDIVAGPGFQAILGPGEFVVDRGFVSAFDAAQRLAAANGVTVHVNQVFRIEGAAVSGAVVQPASFSAHKIGRAFDVNLSVGSGGTQPSAAIKSAKADSPMGRFRDGMKSAGGCRYGGEFATSDPPHFDRQLMPAGKFDWKCLFYFNQRQVRLAQKLPAAIPLVSDAT